MRPNQRVSSLALSTTIALDSRAKQLIAEGRDVINMSVGEPDFDAPEIVQAAAAATVRSGRVRYTPAEGTQSLRRTIAAHVSATRGVPFTPSEIAVCHSAKHALSDALLSLIETGDEVLLLLPAWVSYVEIVKYAGGVSGQIAGLMQVNAVVPQGLSGAVPVAIRVGGVDSQPGVTIAVK